MKPSNDAGLIALRRLRQRFGFHEVPVSRWGRVLPGVKKRTIFAFHAEGPFEADRIPIS
jgi:hypothetical protein